MIKTPAMYTIMDLTLLKLSGKNMANIKSENATPADLIVFNIIYLIEIIEIYIMLIVH